MTTMSPKERAARRRDARVTTDEMQAACDAFNAKHKPGDTIECWPGVREGKPVQRTVREPGAVILSVHTAVVYVTGGGGCIALTHVAE